MFDAAPGPEFQSPIHRGWVFKAGVEGRALADVLSFNPLFIGAGFLSINKAIEEKSLP